MRLQRPVCAGLLPLTFLARMTAVGREVPVRASETTDRKQLKAAGRVSGRERWHRSKEQIGRQPATAIVRRSDARAKRNFQITRRRIYSVTTIWRRQVARRFASSRQPADHRYGKGPGRRLHAGAESSLVDLTKFIVSDAHHRLLGRCAAETTTALGEFRPLPPVDNRQCFSNRRYFFLSSCL